jgi:hypothetical protein
MKFYKKLTDGKKSALIGIILIGILFSILFFYANKRKEKLNENPFITFGIVEKLKPNASKSTITEQDVIYFYFIKNDTVFHKVTTLSVGNIENKKIELNNAYELKVAESDNGIFKIDFNKKLNKYIDKTKYLNHIYNSQKHRNLIE